MIPRELVGTAEVPGGPPLRLFRRGADHMIVLDRNELMSTRMRGSEEALGAMTCDRLGARGSPRLLIGGYGMGFTLRAVLARLGPEAAVTVAELVPGIIDWARGPMADLTAGCLDDPRVTLVIGDVRDAIRGAGQAPTTVRPELVEGRPAIRAEGRPSTSSGRTEGDGPAPPMTCGYDAILLDVDNGPDGLTRPANDALYGAAGLAAARAALRPGGMLAVWSAAPDAAFARRLAGAGFAVEEVRVRARANGKGPVHVIWFGVRR